MRIENEIGKYYDWWLSPPTPAELFLAESLAEVNFISGSYRGAKTVAACKAAIRHATVFENAIVGIFRQFRADLQNSSIKTLAWLINPSWVDSVNNTEMSIRLKNGSTFIGFPAADHVKLGSIELSLAIIDETTQLAEESYTQISARLSHKLYLPSNYSEMPEDVQRWVNENISVNPLIAVANPESPGHWCYKLFIDEQTRIGNCRSVTTNSLENINLPLSYTTEKLIPPFLLKPRSHTKEEIEGWVLKVRDGSLPLGSIIPYFNTEGKRKVCGQWIGSDSGVFPFDPTTMKICEAPVLSVEEEKGSIVIAGVDFGYHHPRLIVMKAVPNHAEAKWTFYVIDYWGKARSTGNNLVVNAKLLQKKHSISTIYVPHDQPGLVNDLRNEVDCQIERTVINVASGISKVTETMADSRFFYLEDESVSLKDVGTFEKEMGGYSWMVDKNGRSTDQPLKKDDHYCDAVRGAIHTFSTRNPLMVENRDSGEFDDGMTFRLFQDG
jgi:hypothetical protein